MISNPENGIVTLPTHHSVEETAAKLKETLRAKGIKLFALIDHSGEAESAGLPMPPTGLLIFGNPKAGTPLTIASPSNAIDFPLKVLVCRMPTEKSGSPTIVLLTFRPGVACLPSCC